MKSAYGLKVPEPDSELTRVGSGTPCGELMIDIGSRSAFPLI